MEAIPEQAVPGKVLEPRKNVASSTSFMSMSRKSENPACRREEMSRRESGRSPSWYACPGSPRDRGIDLPLQCGVDGVEKGRLADAGLSHEGDLLSRKMINKGREVQALPLQGRKKEDGIAKGPHNRPRPSGMPLSPYPMPDRPW